MQSFDTKDSNTLESFDRKFESSDTFGTKDSELEQLGNDFVESFERKFEITDEEALPDSESFDTKDSNDSIPILDNFNANSNDNEQSSGSSDCVSLTSQGSEKSKTDGRCKPRSQKQIEAYKRNFNARKSLEMRIDELDLRVRHLQSLVLSLLIR